MNSPSPDDMAVRRIHLLEDLVQNLLREVEALRAAMIELGGRQPAQVSENALDDEAAGVAGPHSIYGKAYLEAAWLSHWSAGTTSGYDKLRALFSEPSSRVNAFPEIAMLQRLGYSAEQIQQYVQSVQAAETCT